MPLFGALPQTLDRMGAATQEAEAKHRQQTMGGSVSKEALADSKKMAMQARAEAAERARLGAITQQTISTKDLDKVQRTASKGMSALGNATAQASRGLMATMGAGTATAGGLIGKGIGAVARSPVGMIAGMTGAFALLDLMLKKPEVDETDYSGAGNKYMQAGQITPTSFAKTAAKPETAKMTDTKRISSEVQAYAQSSRYKIQDSAMKGMSAEDAKNYLAVSGTRP